VNLGRKIGPLPVWAWLLLAAVAGYIVYRRVKSSNQASTGPLVETTPQPVAAGAASATPDTSLGAVPSAGSPSDTGSTTSDLVTALGGQQASLLDALEARNQDVITLAGMQIQALQTGTALSSTNTQTQPLVGSQPGGSNAPTTSYVQPQAVTVPTSPAAAQTATRTSAASTGGGQPFGGVTSVRKLKSGATLTTYASGRQVEQAPGKSPYVVRA
jgi:hypothetical protein